MAVAALSPWPTSQAALAAATACLKAEVYGQDLTDDRVKALGGAAAALVEAYAPDAPQAVKNEAVIRCAGWLTGQPSSNIRGEAAGELSIEYAPSMQSALRHSGAMALLTTWKVRRAGAI